MKIYHYASINNWREIQEGSYKSRGEPGLGASLRVCKDNYEERESRGGAVFGLLEPEPGKWVSNTDFPVAWQYLASHAGKLLLEYEPTGEILDSSYLIDWSHMERLQGGHKDTLGIKATKATSFEDRVAAEKAYWSSRIPLIDYIDSPQIESELILPEVITMCNVPASIIEISDTQPFLHNLPPFDKDQSMLVIEQFPELEVLSAHLDS